eukprot:gnl/TRDRNA2_/TRDRNA2_108210_c0_seq3.p1 gnl/TRDRNA2_/TRDRNA2_108210_c0~~gnl/TRDRNA2_/TRDRNA2_108210_c0_seq3.p1  ORF type:complete len:100 (+),score=6.12 gnl/TRDRNA2_/TRDRNA2_108210_c0_seq3:163-462(+)
MGNTVAMSLFTVDRHGHANTSAGKSTANLQELAWADKQVDFAMKACRSHCSCLERIMLGNSNKQLITPCVSTALDTASGFHPRRLCDKRPCKRMRAHFI